MGTIPKGENIIITLEDVEEERSTVERGHTTQHTDITESEGIGSVKL